MSITLTQEPKASWYHPRQLTTSEEISHDLSEKSTQLIRELIEFTNYFLVTQQRLNSATIMATKTYLTSNSKRQQFQRGIKQ